jgi:hypothetical protein
MPNTPNASFIPKQGPVRKVRQTASRQVHFLTIVSYVLFVSTLVASGGVFLYNRHLESRLASEVEKLDATTGGFSDADMNTVREFNIRLHQAQSRLDKSISLVTVLGALEEVTLKAAQITELTIKREGDVQVAVDAKVNTDSFDSSLFQRGVYERNSVTKDVKISDLTLEQAAAEEGGTPGISFVTKIVVPISDIPYKPADLNVVNTVPAEVASTTETTTTTASTTSNSVKQ